MLISLLKLKKNYIFFLPRTIQLPWTFPVLYILMAGRRKERALKSRTLPRTVITHIDIYPAGAVDKSRIGFP